MSYHAKGVKNATPREATVIVEPEPQPILINFILQEMGCQALRVEEREKFFRCFLAEDNAYQVVLGLHVMQS